MSNSSLPVRTKASKGSRLSLTVPFGLHITLVVWFTVFLVCILKVPITGTWSEVFRVCPLSTATFFTMDLLLSFNRM